MQVEDARQQEGGGDEDLGEQLGHIERLQAQVLQTESDLRSINP